MGMRSKWNQQMQQARQEFPDPMNDPRRTYRDSRTRGRAPVDTIPPLQLVLDAVAEDKRREAERRRQAALREQRNRNNSARHDAVNARRSKPVQSTGRGSGVLGFVFALLMIGLAVMALLRF